MPDSNTRQLPQQSEAMNHISKYLGVENVKQEKWWHVNKQVRISLYLKYLLNVKWNKKIPYTFNLSLRFILYKVPYTFKKGF